MANGLEYNITKRPVVEIRTNEPYSLFEVRIVSPEVMNTVKQNRKSTITVLKIKKGLDIGLVTDGILYLRGDLDEKNFPLNETNDVDLKDKIGLHLADIVFGSDNTKIDLFNNKKKYLIWFDTMYTRKDLDDMNRYINLINDLSPSKNFEDEEIGLPSYQPNYNPVPYNYYKISFIDQDLMSDKIDNRKTDSEKLLKEENGETVGLVSIDHLWLLDTLKNQKRSYFLLKGLLFSMGFHGESQNKNSFFYRSNFSNVNLSSLDKDAFILMYGGRIYSGMDMEGVRKALGLSSED